MENNNDAMIGTPRCNSGIKVHGSMCSQLTIMLDKVTSILPSIEAAQPGCRAGIEELCNLYNTVDKGKLIIQNCIECSSLYLAITGEAIAMRCERIRNSMRRSLFLIQNMIPSMLANQVVDIHDDLRDMKFHVDPTEEEAGKEILRMLRQSDATQELERQTFLLACSKLNLTTPKDILVERRAIKKLLSKINGNDPKKDGILNFFLYLVRKYGKDIKPETGAKNETVNTAKQSIFTNLIASSNSNLDRFTPDTNSWNGRYEDRNNFSGVATPPAELCCPISMKLMCDPVIISSGQTYERENIERWFSEGYDTCPRTQLKLENFKITPNTCMQAVIYNWCKDHRLECTYLPEEIHSRSSLHDISVPLIADRNRDYIFEHSSSSFALSDTSYLSSQVRETDVSKASFTQSLSSLHDISVPLIADRNLDYMVDHSSSSFELSGASYLPYPVRETGVPKTSFAQLYSSANCQLYLSFCNFDKEMFLNFLHELSVLPVELQRKAIEDLKNVLNGENQIWHYMLSNGFIEAFLQFIKNDNAGYTLQAQKNGIQFFLTFLCKSRTRLLPITEEAVRLIVSLLDSELKLEALLILHELLHHPSCRGSPLMASVVAPSVIGTLDNTGDNECLELALQITCELSSSNDVKPLLVSPAIITKLSTMLSEVSLAEYCLKILRNLCEVKQAADLIVRSDDCLGSISDHLETGSREEQELACVILHTVLCSRGTEDRVLVMKEGVVSALVDLSVNGTEVAKASSAKLLQLLTESRVACAADGAVESSPNRSTFQRPVSRSARFIPRKLNIFSRPRSPFAGSRLRTL